MSFFFKKNKIKKYLTHRQASMLPLAGEMPVNLEGHTALGIPWEWTEYLNILHRIGIRGEEAENHRGKKTGFQERKAGRAQDETRSRSPGLGSLSEPSPCSLLCLSLGSSACPLSLAWTLAAHPPSDAALPSFLLLSVHFRTRRECAEPGTGAGSCKEAGAGVLALGLQYLIMAPPLRMAPARARPQIVWDL